MQQLGYFTFSIPDAGGDTEKYRTNPSSGPVVSRIFPAFAETAPRGGADRPNRCFMSKPSNTIRPAIWILLLCVVFLAASAYSLHATSSQEFCLSCHEMEQYAKEIKFSSHAKDKDGKPIACNQCHIPPGVGPRFVSVKIYSGVKDLAVHVVTRPDKLDRLAHQPTARRFIDDANCLACHEDLYKDAKGEKKISETGRLAHDAYLNKNGNTKSNCAGCHINLAHLPEFDQRLEVNAAFKARLLEGKP